MFSILDKIFEKLLLPVVDEKLKGFRYGRNVELAVIQLQSDDADDNLKGLSIIKELLKTDPADLQELYDILCRFVSVAAAKDKRADASRKEAVLAGLRLLCSMPKYDKNGWPYNIEICAIHLKALQLHCHNFENFVVSDSIFENVDFSRSSFKNCDLGGSQFVRDSSVEWCNFQGAKLNVSFLTGQPSTFWETRLWGTNL